MMRASASQPARPRTIAACLVIALLGVATAPPPVAAQSIKDTDLFTKSLDAAHQAINYFGLWDNPEQLQRINEIGYRVVQASGFRGYPFMFFLIDMPEPNALALPGGQIFITRGMLALDLDDDQLAALLGHEIAHVVLDHGMRMQRRATMLNILSTAALVGVILAADRSSSQSQAPYYDPYGRDRDRGADLIQGTMATSLVLGELLLRSYGREFEHEADAEGQRWAAAAGFAANGAERLMSTMRERLPESKQYGYWRTHPFFDQRVTGAEARSRTLTSGEVRLASDLRQRTQAVLLDYARRPPDPRAAERAERRTAPPAADDLRPQTPRISQGELLRLSALAAWPQGPAAERLRLASLQKLRSEEESRPLAARNWGRVLAAYEQQEAEIRELTPESELLARLEQERVAIQEQLDEIYPNALEILEGGVYQTAFLATFLDNFPESPQVPSVALAMGNAYSRLGRQNEAVPMYLRVVEHSPAGEAAAAARRGLRSLTPVLDDLAALQSLASDADDAELRELAVARLQQRVGSFEQLENGATYLRSYPESTHTEAVRTRLDQLADKALSEVILYQSIGDHGEAVERIHLILSYAPLSPAAERLREGVEVKS